MKPGQINQQTEFGDEPQKTYMHNHNMLVSVLSGAQRAAGFTPEGNDICIHLERILIDRREQTFVTFEGDTGIEAVLTKLHDYLSAFEEERHGGHLMGLVGSLVSARGVVVGVRITLEAGGQIVYEVGPTTHMRELLQAIEHVDRQIHVATHALGCNYELLAEGYNPYVDAPLDVPLVPRTRWTLLNAYLSQTGRYARDMMRCCCATHVSLRYPHGRDGMDMYRIATALSPITMFLTDNVRSFRSSGARLCPRMTRSLVWEEIDPQRCGVVPGTFSDGFSAQEYAKWLESRRTILFTDAMGTTTSTGKRTTRELMEERTLSASESLGLLSTVYPTVRLSRRMELRGADSLRPILAVGYACFLKGIFCNSLSLDGASDLFGQVSDDEVSLAAYELRVRGWNATVYGMPIGELVQRLVQLARNGLRDREELNLFNRIGEMWDVGMIPRDAFVHQEEKKRRGY